jgi:hypothetical protein
LKADGDGTTLAEALEHDETMWRRIRDAFAARGIDAASLFADPAQYRGQAAERTVSVVRRYRRVVENMRGALDTAAGTWRSSAGRRDPGESNGDVEPRTR